MRLTSFARGLVENFGVKLVALIVALMIWFNASGQQEVKRNYVASLRFVNLPDSLTLTGDIPQTAEISVSASRRELLPVGFRKIGVMVNMARATPGRFSQRLSPSDVVMPRNIEPGNVRILSPVSVEVGVERVVSKRVRVAVMLSGSLVVDQLLDGVPSARPAAVTVTGPESAVRALTKMPTKPIDLGKVREPVERETELDYDRAVFTCDPERVVVSISTSARGRRVLANIPPTILVDDDTRLTEVFPKTVSLTIEGPRSLLDTLSSGDVSVLVDLSGVPPGEYTLSPEVIVPDGVERYLLDVDSLKILVRRAAPAATN
jgi:YbbR domain-containing protein